MEQEGQVAGENGEVARSAVFACITLAACGLAHPALVSEGLYTPYPIFVLTLNYALLCILIARTCLNGALWVYGFVVSRSSKGIAWLAPVLLMTFGLLHAGYDTLFYRMALKVLYLMTWGVRF